MDDDERTELRNSHQSQINESWSRAKTAIEEALSLFVDPTRCIWPAGANNASRKKRAAISAHETTIQFRDDVHPFRKKRQEVKELWKEPVDTITPGDTDIDVSLANLEEFEYLTIEDTTTECDPIEGEKTVKNSYRVLLPLSSCKKLYRQIEDVCVELGLGAQTQSKTPEDEAKPEHLVGLLGERGQSEATDQLPARFQNGHDEDEDEPTEADD
jgi:hypothetical protein